MGRKARLKKRTGWVTPNSTIRMPRRYIIDNGLEPQKHWDDWQDYRDGFRDWASDRKKLKKDSIILYKSWYPELIEKLLKNNNKLKRLLKRRKAMKNNPRVA